MIGEHAGSFLKNKSDLIKRILVGNVPLILGY